jgi:hypothetical protein
VNVEELLRQQLHSEADAVSPIDGLLETSTRLGRRKQLGRRTAVTASGIAAAAIVVAGSVVVADSGGGTTAKVTPATGGPSTAASDSSPWWQSWTTDRHFGPADQTFLTNARPTYDVSAGPEPITVWATGSEPDGTDWAMFTDPHDGHVIQWLQGWNGQPDFGDSTQNTTPGIDWTSFASPTLAAHNDYQLSQEWLIVVGKPGTTEVQYSADGTDFTPLDVQDGIAVVKIDGSIPGAARVQLSDANGVYATGTPFGAGADATSSSPSPGSGPGTATPSTTPGDATREPTIAPSG